jgi:hypothetical protein
MWPSKKAVSPTRLAVNGLPNMPHFARSSRRTAGGQVFATGSACDANAGCMRLCADPPRPGSGHPWPVLMVRGRPYDYLRVTPQLQVVGFDSVYALGDIAAIDINKASVAARQAQIVAANIQAQLAANAERTTYTPAPPVIILPLGPTGGAGQLPNQDDIATAEFVSQVKGGA